MDGARFANAVAFLGCAPAEAAGPVDALSFGFIKNGGMGADAIVFFEPEKAAFFRNIDLRGVLCGEILDGEVGAILVELAHRDELYPFVSPHRLVRGARAAAATTDESQFQVAAGLCVSEASDR